MRVVILASLLAVLTCPEFAMAQTLGRGESVGPSIVRVIAAMVICLGLAVIVTLAVARWRGGKDAKLRPRTLPDADMEALTVRRTVRLSPGHHACHVQLGDREWVAFLSASAIEVVEVPNHAGDDDL